jgi:uncharacterized protein (DUF1697 family)
MRSVALLRGINVGTAKAVGMAQLREALEGIGYTEVRTHLRSGNVVFTSTPAAARTAAADIEAAVLGVCGVRSTVVLRSADAFARAVTDAPLLDRMTDPARFLVGFFASTPDGARADALGARDHGPDAMAFAGDEVYLWCPNGIADSPFGKVRWEKELGVEVTMRNWNTVTKILELTTA